MKVLYITAECKPLSKVGGVGDVAGELPPALKEQGVDIEIVTPCCGQTLQKNPALNSLTPEHEYFLTFHGAREHISILRTEIRGVPVNLLKSPAYFETDYTLEPDKAPFTHPLLFRNDYSTPYVYSREIPYFDDALRFSFFCRACLPLIQEKDPDIVHINDWVMGYLPGWMKIMNMPQKQVLTIHNIGYQGNIHRQAIQNWDMQEIDRHQDTVGLFTDPRREWNCVNALRLAMEMAHVTNTVSPTYKKEITMPQDQSRFFQGGSGLDEVAARLDSQGRLHGILNGFEYSFSPDDAGFESMIREKSRMKAALANNFPDPDGLLLGFVGRAVEQKFRLLREEVQGKSVLENILDIPGVNVAVLATGEPEYESFLRSLSDRPNLYAVIAFDTQKAGQISLGSDVFLMPSLFEPCGIIQMQSMSHATPPLVRWTGGLADTVRPHNDPEGTGFGFDGSSRREILTNQLEAVNQARQVYTQNPLHFRALQYTGYYERFLWENSAREYIEKLYQPVMAGS